MGSSAFRAVGRCFGQDLEHSPVCALNVGATQSREHRDHRRTYLTEEALLPLTVPSKMVCRQLMPGRTPSK